MVYRSLGVAALLGALALPAMATPLLSVDFNGRSSYGTGAVGPTQAGFVSFAGPTSSQSSVLHQTYTTTAGDITVSVGATGETVWGRDRGAPANAGALTIADIYRDFLFNGSGTGPITVGLTGLSPSASYALTLYSYDDYPAGDSSPSTVTWQVTTGTGASGSISFQRNAAAPTSNDQFATTLDVTTDATGALTVHATRTAGTGAPVVVNGFELTAMSVPEPASLGLLGLGALALLRRR